MSFSHLYSWGMSARDHLEGLELVEDVSPARWLVESLWPSWDLETPEGRGNRVGSIVPPGFEAYVRIFHPASRRWAHGSQPVRWSEVAATTGRTVHPEMEWSKIVTPAGPDYPHWGESVPSDDLGPALCARLETVLRRFTQSPDACWFCIWVGYGNLGFIPADVARVSTDIRRYYLFRGPLEPGRFRSRSRQGAWSRLQAPDIWWPDDRSWVVGGDTDLNSTYVACSEECADALLADPSLETLRTRAEARVDMNADHINK